MQKSSAAVKLTALICTIPKLVGSIRSAPSSTGRFKDFWMTDTTKFFRINPARDCNLHCAANGKNRLVLEYLSTTPGHVAKRSLPHAKGAWQWR